MKRMKWKRVGAAVLTLAMLLSTVPSAALAAEAPLQEADAAQVQAGTYQIHVTSDEGLAFAAIRDPDGIETGVSEAEAGQKLRMEFIDVNMTPGTAFVRWVDDGGNLTDLANATSYNDCTFTMPAGEVRIHAELAQNCPKITVENGGVMVPNGENYAILNHPYVTAGREVTLYFDDELTPAGKTFKEWYVKSGDVVLSDPGSRDECRFTMPDHDVEIGVRYENAYAISVENGYAQYELPNGELVWNTSTAEAGTQMYLKVNPYTKPEGMAFSKWVVKKGNVDLIQPYSSFSCPFIMPGEDVEIVAEFVPGNQVTVNNGAVCKTIPGDEFDWYIDMAAPGDQVWAYYSAKSYPAPEGMEFARWVVTQGSMQLDAPEDKVCSFTMPDEAVEISAIFKPEGGKLPFGWHSDAAGSWFNDETGRYVTGWQEIEGNRHYFYENGYMAKDTCVDGQCIDENGIAKPVQSGWQFDDHGWWYNDENGSRLTGWQQLGGFWFYFAENGYMLTGWQAIGGNWFYLDGNGHMMTGWQQIGGNWFYLNGLGHMLTGWQTIDGNWYYFNSLGHMLTGWQWIDGKCYYFYSSGYMATSTWIGGSYVDASGAWVQNPVATGWQSNSTGWWYNDENGNYVTGWQQIGSFWFYFSGNGYMQTGWQAISGAWYYFDGNGHMMTGWQWIDGNCYYFYDSGYMATNTWIGGSYVNGSGVWVQ